MMDGVDTMLLPPEPKAPAPSPANSHHPPQLGSGLQLCEGNGVGGGWQEPILLSQPTLALLGCIELWGKEEV